MAGPSSNVNTPDSLDHDTAACAPMVALSNAHNKEDPGSQAGLFDDELTAVRVSALYTLLS
jgi:hypothetical protein